MTKLEIAKKYGVSCRTINRWMVCKGMPYIKNTLNNSVRFDEKEVEEWMKTMFVDKRKNGMRG